MTRVKVIYGESIRTGLLTIRRPKHIVTFDDGETMVVSHHWPCWWPTQAIYQYLKCETVQQKRTLTRQMQLRKRIE